MRRKSILSSINSISKSISKLMKKEPKNKKTNYQKSNSQTSSIKPASNQIREIKEGYTYSSSGAYTRSEYNIIQEAFKYAYSGDLEFVDKIVESNKNIFRPSDLHFLYNALQESLYKKREDQVYLDKTINVCLRDLELLKKGLLPDLINNATLPCLNRLAIIYEKHNMIPEAIEVLRFAVDHNCLGTFSAKLERLLNNTNIDKVEKPKRVREKYNENGLCEREVKLLELLTQELVNRGVNVKLEHYILSNGNMEIRFNDAFVAKVKIRNNTDAYFENTINSFNDWINNYIKQQQYQQSLINKILNR